MLLYERRMNALTDISHELLTRSGALPSQLQKAARWIAKNPRDVALMSMRTQAQAAGVQPATMTRLAQALGFEGYNALRARYANALRGGGLSEQAERRIVLKADSAEAAVMAMLGHSAAQLDGMARGPRAMDCAEALLRAAQIVRSADQIFCLGLRSSHAVAWHFSYTLSLITPHVRLLDQAGGTGLDPLLHAGPGDVLFVCGMAPYTRAVVEATAQARRAGVKIIALTDSAASPLTCPGETVLIAPIASTGFLHAMTPAFALADTLATLVAQADDPEMAARLGELDRQLAALNTYFSDPV